MRNSPVSPAQAVIRFERKAYLSQGTLRDNLLFGLRAKAPSAEGDPLEKTRLPSCWSKPDCWIHWCRPD